MDAGAPAVKQIYSFRHKYRDQAILEFYSHSHFVEDGVQGENPCVGA
jgi:hypothetical protein